MLMDIRDYIKSIQSEIPGLQSLSITDKEGVTVFSSCRPGFDINKEELQILSVIFTLTHEQCQKLEEFGETDYLLTEYEDGSSLMQVNFSPLLISLRAEDTTRNVLIDCANKLRIVLGELRKQIALTI